MAQILGLDIDKHVVRGALLKTGVSRAEFLSFFEVPIDTATHGGPDAEEHAPLKHALEELSAQMPRTPDTVIASLDGREASLRVVDLPAVAAKKVSAILPFELETLVPFAPEDTIIAHQPISRGEQQLRLLAAATPIDRVSAALQPYSGSPLEPRELALGAAALDGLPAVSPELQSHTDYWILEIRRDHTEVCALHQDRCTYARTLSLGIEHLSADGGAFVAEIKKTLLHHLSAGEPAPEVILVAGEIGESAEFMSWLQETLPADVQPVPLPGRGLEGEPAATRFARAIALAGRSRVRGNRINLRQGMFAPRRAASFFRTEAKLLSAATLSIAAAAAFAAYMDYKSVQADNSHLRRRLAETTGALLGASIDDVDDARELLLEGTSGNDPLPRFTAFDGLAAVANLIPEDQGHQLRSLEIEVGDASDEGDITLKGAFGESDSDPLSSIEEGLRGQECFREVRPARTRSGGRGKTNYEISAVVRCPWQDQGSEDEG